MSLYARLRRKRRRTFKPFIKDSNFICGIFVYQIHEIPKSIDYGCEIDFWIVDQKDCYMLRIEKSKDQIVCFSRKNFEDPLYCIMKIDIDFLDIREQLLILKNLGIPYKAKGEIRKKLSN